MGAAAVSLAALPVTGPPACVVDARLALSRLGVHAITRLVGEFSVWLPRELREILRDVEPYMNTPERLLPRVYCAALRNIDPLVEAEGVRSELAQWSRLPQNDELAALAIHYLGDRADECSLPRHVDRSLRERCESLQKGLDLLMRRSGYDLPRGQIVGSCMRDTVSLSAALHPYRAFILTRLESDVEEAPSLCSYLEAWGIATKEVPSCGGHFSRPIREAVARGGLGPISWSGVPLAVAHVVVNGFPVLGGGHELGEETVSRLWQGATVFWHRI